MISKLKQFRKTDLYKTIKTYTILFILIELFIGFTFLKYRKGFISSSDGFNQHFVSLTNFRRMLIGLIKTGHFNIFTWNINLGVDMFANWSYYVFGDFASYLSIFCPEKYLYLFYNVLSVFRMYFPGISFIIYAKYKKASNKGAIIGALIYTYCCFNLLVSVHHPYFISSVALFPLLMYFIESFVNDEKNKLGFSIMVFITIITSFYFGYMMCLSTGVYGIILIINKYKNSDIKCVIFKTIEVLIYALIGVLLSAFILFPTIIQYLQGSRGVNFLSYEYYKSYYKITIFSPLTFGGINWSFLGVNAIAFVLIPYAIKAFRINKCLIIYLLTFMLPLFIAPLGSIYSCLSCPMNRWVYMLVFCFAILSALGYDEIKKTKTFDFKPIIYELCIFSILSLIFRLELSKLAIANITIFSLFLLFICYYDYLKEKVIIKIKLSSIVFYIGLAISTCMIIYYYYDVAGNFYMKNNLSLKRAVYLYKTNNGKVKNFDEAIKYIKSIDNDYYRISKYPGDLFNASLYHKYNSINGYYSINPSLIEELSYDLANTDYITNHYINEFNYRNKIVSLLGTKYYITDSKVLLDNYSLIKTIGPTKIYKNNYFVPFGAFYDEYIDLDDYENLSEVEKESALTKAVTLDKKSVDRKVLNKKNYIKREIDREIINIPYHTEQKLKNNKVNISKNNKQIIFYLDKDVEGEVYFKINNLKYTPYTREEKIKQETKNIKDKALIAKVKKNIFLYDPSNEFSLSLNYNNYIHNKTYYDTNRFSYSGGNSVYLEKIDAIKGDNKIILTLSNEGKYKYDSIEILEIKTNINDYKKLNTSNFKVIEYKDNYLKAKVNSAKEGFMQFSTTYNKGFEVYINGKKTKTYVANKYFLGTYIPKGKSVIEIHYHNKYIKYGFIISISTLLGIGFWIGRKKLTH